MKAVIRGTMKTLTVDDLAAGTLFKVNSQLSNRLFVKTGDGLSTPSYSRVGGKKLKGRTCEQPPVYAIIIPTADRFDRRAFTPATNKINGSTPVVSTHGQLVVEM